MLLSLVLIDHQNLFREGLQALLKQRKGWHLVAETDSVRTAIPVVKKLRPKVIVASLMTLAPAPVPAIRELRRVFPKIGIVALVNGTEHSRVPIQTRAAGANAVVSKTDAFVELVRAIDAANQGLFYLSPSLRDHMTRNHLADAPDPIAALSVREREIFDCVSQGLSTKSIAHNLHISIKTVESHRTHINAKLGFRSSADLVRFAATHGLLTLSPPALQRSQ